MKIKICYKYIPNIDWEDPRVKTDEGLLEVCGCSKDKAKEYAEYCRKKMEEFDKNNNQRRNQNQESVHYSLEPCTQEKLKIKL